MTETEIIRWKHRFRTWVNAQPGRRKQVQDALGVHKAQVSQWLSTNRQTWQDGDVRVFGTYYMPRADRLAKIEEMMK